MNRKGFANIVLAILVVILAGAIGYLTLVKKPTIQPATSEQLQAQNNAPTQPAGNNQSPTIPKDNIKVYINTDYGFQINNPKNYTITEESKSYGYCQGKKDDKHCSIGFRDKDNRFGLSLSIIFASNKPLSYFVEEYNNATANHLNIQTSSVSINGVPAVRAVLCCVFSNGTIQYDIVHNGFWYQFIGPALDMPNNEFDAIVASLKFF